MIKILLTLLFTLHASRFTFGWSPPPIVTERLPNGLQLYLLEDDKLPLFEARLYIKVGDVYEPRPLTGLADIVANLLVTGGTQDKTPKELDEILDQKAIHLSAEAGRELTTITVSSLSHQWSQALDLLGEVLSSPRWDPERFNLSIHRYLEGLRRDEDSPETIASRAFRQALYGEKHPWARLPTPKSLHRLHIKDLQDFHQKYFHPNRMLLALAGDFPAKELKKWVHAWALSLKTTPVQEPVFEKLPFQNKPGTKKIKKKLTQTFIEVGHLGIERFAKEEYAYGLLQYILGGEVFTSRLGADIRSEKGLAYGIYSDWDANPVRGMFRISVQTKIDSSKAVLETIREHLERLSYKADVTAKELLQAKEAMINSYIFWFDSSFKRVFMRAKFDLLGFPKDYLIKYPNQIRKTTLEDVKKVAREYIQPEGLKVVIVGP